MMNQGERYNMQKVMMGGLHGRLQERVRIKAPNSGVISIGTEEIEEVKALEAKIAELDATIDGLRRPAIEIWREGYIEAEQLEKIYCKGLKDRLEANVAELEVELDLMEDEMLAHASQSELNIAAVRATVRKEAELRRTAG